MSKIEFCLVGKTLIELCREYPELVAQVIERHNTAEESNLENITTDASKKPLGPPYCAVWSLDEAKKSFENGADYVYCTWADARKFKKVKSIKEAVEFYTDGRFKTTAEPNCGAAWDLGGAIHSFKNGMVGVYCISGVSAYHNGINQKYHLARTIAEAELFFSK